MKRCFLSSISAVLIRDSKVFIPRFWFYSMWEISFLLVLLVFIYLIYPSIYFKIVWPQVCFSLLMSSLQGKGNFQKPNLCFGGLGNFPQKIFSQTNYLYINKSLQEICCSFFEALSINESFQLNYSRFNSTQSKNSHNNRAFLFPFSRKKNHSPFSLNFVYGPQSSHRDQW